MHKATSGYLLLLLFFASSVYAQQWVDTLYQIRTEKDVEYGKAIDFAGNIRSLTIDISYPLNDTPPNCGRPLLVAVHGGSFMAGSKEDPTPHQWMIDFAKRGYTTISVNYRLGMFQTHEQVHCNVTDIFNTPWDCANMADTSEWHRASYRAMQDVKGAIRYILLQKQQYNVDPRNVFLMGESAGGFTVLQTAFLDSSIEKHSSCGELPSVSAPNGIYESTCIQKGNFDTSIASMQLTRPDLGQISGSLNISAPSYTIKGVANFYGGMFTDLFAVSQYQMNPILYMFHQPNDLIVPYTSGRVLGGYSSVMTGLGCVNLVNTPFTYGSSGMKSLMDSLKGSGVEIPEYIADFTNNTADGLTQLLNPALAGHSVQDYGGTSYKVAQLFADRIDTSDCEPLSVRAEAVVGLNCRYDGATNSISIDVPDEVKVTSIQVISIVGAVIEIPIEYSLGGRVSFKLPNVLSKGVYFVSVSTDKWATTSKVLIE